MRILIAATLTTIFIASAAGQQLTLQNRAEEIASAFSKHKSAVKEKYGVRVEKYKDVRSEPLVKTNISDYSGRYEVPELGNAIDIQVGRDAIVHARLFENGQPSSVRLENARIDGALFTATKVNQDGTTEKFEGAFLTRTDRNSPTDKGVTLVGFGVLLTTPLQIGSITYDKLFYQLK
jgi:hypothetical protein